MKKILLLITGIFLLPSITAGAGVCAIIDGPPPELASYMTEVNAKLNTLSQQTRIDRCGPNFKNEQRFLEAMDRIDIQSELSADIVNDFRYNILIAAEGNSRNLVINQGVVLHNIENRVTSILKSSANTCNLETTISDLGGKSVESYLSEILTYNRKVESYFKTVTSGSTEYPEGVSDDNTLFTAIASNYSPAMTSGCENQFAFESIISKGLTKINQNNVTTEKSLDGWKKAIQIFAGTDGTLAERNARAQKLLQKELSRQGIAQSAQSIMLKNLSCFQRDSNTASTIEELGKIRSQCTLSFVEGLKNITDPLEKSFRKVTNTDVYMKKLLTITKEKSILKDDVVEVWNEMEKTILSVNETNVNQQILSDLASVHAQLVTLNALFKKKIPDMQKNCMKQYPGVEGACR